MPVTSPVMTATDGEVEAVAPARLASGDREAVPLERCARPRLDLARIRLLADGQGAPPPISVAQAKGALRLFLAN
ncbi:MAG: hypothetical protein NVSMB48_05560 [Marmoricola sp.]